MEYLKYLVLQTFHLSSEETGKALDLSTIGQGFEVPWTTFCGIKQQPSLLLYDISQF